MKRIGIFLRSAREASGLTIHVLSRETRIKPEFLEYLEDEKWERLPELPIVIGFVKNICEVLNLNRDQAVAILRRDYPPKTLVINPKPDIKGRFQFGPRMVLSIFVLSLLLIFGGYLYYQYHVFVSPPALTVISPSDNEKVTERIVVVRGTTDTSAAVLVNNQPARVDKDGNFTDEIEVIPETRDIEIKAVSRSGRETVIHRTIEVKLK